MNGRTWRILALILLLGAAATVAYGVGTGDVGFAFFLIFPVFYGTGPLALLAVLLLFGAFAAWTAGAFSRARLHAAADPGAHAYDDPRSRPSWAPREEEEWVERSGGASGRDEPRETERSRGKWGGVVLLGPIPIAFGNDRRMLAVLMGIALLIVLAVLVLSLAGRGG